MDPEFSEADLEAINKLIDEVEKSNKQWKMMKESRRIEAANKAASVDKKFDQIIARLEKMMPTPKSESEPEVCVPVETDMISDGSSDAIEVKEDSGESELDSKAAEFYLGAVKVDAMVESVGSASAEIDLASIDMTDKSDSAITTGVFEDGDLDVSTIDSTQVEVTSNLFSVDFSSVFAVSDAVIGEESFETKFCISNDFSDFCLLPVCENASINWPTHSTMHMDLSDRLKHILPSKKKVRVLKPPAKPPDCVLMCVLEFDGHEPFPGKYYFDAKYDIVKSVLQEGEVCKKNMDVSDENSGRWTEIILFFNEDHVEYFEEIKEEYAEFYTSLSNACKEQLGVKHFSTKGQQPEFEVIVLMPQSAPFDPIAIKKKPYSINFVILQQNMFLKVIRKYLAKKNGYEVLNMVDVINKYVVGLLKELCVVSPCESVWKHWIGGKANHATHMVVFSQANMDGEGEVIHAFKALGHEGHNFCSNIHIAYCKNKVGLNSVDNGCLWLDTICVPRENILNSVADFSSDAKEMKLSATVLLQVDFSLGNLYTFGNKSRKMLKLGFTTEEMDDVGAVYQHDILPLKVCHYNKGEKLMVHDYIALSHDDFIIRSAYQKVAGTSNSVGQFESNLSFTFPRLYRVVPDIDEEYQKLPALPAFIKDMICITESCEDGSGTLGDQSKPTHVSGNCLNAFKDNFSGHNNFMMLQVSKCLIAEYVTAKEIKLFVTALLQLDFSLDDLNTFGNKSHKILKLGLTTDEFDNPLMEDGMLHDKVADRVCLPRFANNIFMFSVPRPPEVVDQPCFANNIFMYSVPRPPEASDLDHEINLEAKKVQVTSFGHASVANKVLHLISKCNQAILKGAEVTNLEDKVFPKDGGMLHMGNLEGVVVFWYNMFSIKVM